MKKLLLAFLLFASLITQAQLKSPGEFLGYPLGSKFTPHYKIVNYFNYIASAASSQIQLQQYGETHEGRPLLLAFIASSGNLPKLEEIRKNNLRLTGLLNDKPADVNAPAIVWLSYNVHGNETSSSETAMKVLFELLNPSNAQSTAYLKNTVVIIDPCLNPDGRDRYVNWQMQMVGKTANPHPDAREHSEPWPGGRSNHYNFDLNRDWAWQTQVETQQRLKVYNEWMPHVHSDYHEQDYNNPYFFAPAAEPYHEVITPFQRSFQAEIGRNNAKYFDANGWLYFTREIFDLFYPSYGDTYPIYNGSIGMTFEQAGGPGSSTAISTSMGDTLTLNDRIEHHFTTTMSTLEVVSKNTSKLVSAFKKYFDDARTNGAGEYKTFVITGGNSNKTTALKKLLDANHISYTYSSGAAFKGFNYFTQKEEMFTTNRSLVVSTFQPKAVLVKVLFEPRSKLVDSLTYDITAWALPYVYGIQAYAVKEKITGDSKEISGAIPSMLPVNVYGYLIRYHSFEDAKLLATLIQAGLKIRYAARDFTSGGKNFDKGTLIILRKENEDKLATLQQAARKFNADVTSIESGFMESGFDLGSEKIRYIKRPRVALITGKGSDANAAGEVWHLFDQQLNYPITLINADELNSVDWRGINVLIVPNGSYKFLRDKDESADLKNWVRQGGKIIAMENAVRQMATGEWGIKLKKPGEEKDKLEEEKQLYADLKQFAASDQDGIKSSVAGAVYKVDLDTTHPLTFGIGDHYFALKRDDNIYEFLKDGWNVGVIKKDNYVAGFVGSKTKDKIKDGVIIGDQLYGSGDIIYLPDNPIFRSFWESGKLLLSNAVFLAGQ